MAAFVISPFRVKVFKGAQYVGAGHLFSPVHHKISVIKRPRLQIASLRRGVNTLLVQLLAYQHGFSLFNFDRRGGDSAQDQPCILDRAVLVEVEGRPRLQGRESRMSLSFVTFCTRRGGRF